MELTTKMEETVRNCTTNSKKGWSRSHECMDYNVNRTQLSEIISYHIIAVDGKTIVGQYLWGVGTEDKLKKKLEYKGDVGQKDKYK